MGRGDSTPAGEIKIAAVSFRYNIHDGKYAMRKTLEAIALGALGLLFWITYAALIASAAARYSWGALSVHHGIGFVAIAY